VFDKKFTEFISLLERSKSTVVLTGAGVSTFSGIPDFRSSDGIYSKQYKHLSVEEIISLPLFERDPEIFYSWAKDEWYNLANFEPSIVHIALAKLEETGKLDGLYTQNSDVCHFLYQLWAGRRDVAVDL
jgi:NAD-dependent deacetylase